MTLLVSRRDARGRYLNTPRRSVDRWRPSLPWRTPEHYPLPLP